MQIERATEAMSKARASMSDEAFNDAARVLNKTMDAVREEMQEATARSVGELLTKLKGRAPISTEDLQIARLWIVGDAEGFAKAQHAFDELLTKFTRLEDSLRRCAQSAGAVADLADLHGLLEESVRVSYDIAKHLEEKERVGNFEAAIRDPATIDRELLANILSRKLESHDM